jgi:hypothetical protein
MNIEKVQIKPEQYVWVERRPPMDSEYWIYGRNNEWDTIITKNVLPLESYRKLHDVYAYCTIVAASPELGLDVPTHVEWLAHKIAFKKQKYNNREKDIYKNGIIKGYQTAEQEFPSWEDVRKAISMARETEHDKIKSADEIIELLKSNKQ